MGQLFHCKIILFSCILQSTLRKISKTAFTLKIDKLFHPSFRDMELCNSCRDKMMMKYNWTINMTLLITWHKSSFRIACVHLLLLKKSHTFLFQKSQNIFRVCCKKKKYGEIFLFPSPIYHLLTMQITLFVTQSLVSDNVFPMKGWNHIFLKNRHHSSK